MNITLCSAFRNSMGTIGRYFRQVEELQQALISRGDELHLVLGEGDSTDGTPGLLATLAAPFDAEIVDCSHGGPAYTSVIDDERFRQLAHVANCIWKKIPATAKAVLWVESDLIWEAETMLILLDRLKKYPAISPMIFLRRNGWGERDFYDTFAFRRNGLRFAHYPPYHPEWSGKNIFKLDSAGSCMAMRGTLARKIVWDEQVFVGVSSQIYALGGAVWCDPKLACYHT